MIRLIYCTIFLLPSILMVSQSYPVFESPVKHKIALSGSFGELRTGHFHAGLDIKSKYGIAGDSIFSIGAGYISRIKVEPGGYGYSLYINHPNGFTSVYAHLKEYEESIKEYVYQVQSEEMCFTIDHTPPQEAFPLASRQFIGIMGNTGKSYGAHLHFEIRKTATDKLINPLLFGIKPKDSKSPVIQTLTVLEYDSLEHITHETDYKIKQIDKNTFALTDTLIIKDRNRTELSLKMYDSMNGSINKNGIYNLKLMFADKPIYELRFDSMDFNDSKGIDYLLDKKTKSDKNRTHYLLPTHPISFPFSFSLKDSTHNQQHDELTSIEVSDLEGNTSTLELNFKTTTVEKLKRTSVHNYIIDAYDPNLIQLENYKLFFPSNSFYATQAIFVKELKSQKTNGAYFDLLVINPSYIKLHKNISIHYERKNQVFNEKYCFAHMADSGELNLIQNCTIDSICSATISSLENIIFLKDTIPPKIEPLYSNQKLYKNSTISFKITDNIVPKSKKHLIQYKATLNGKWILFNYDLKTNIISYKLKDSIKSGHHYLELQLTDNQQNTTCYSTDLHIK